MATGSSPISRRARIALASMVVAATALFAIVIASSSPASLKARAGESKIQSAEAARAIAESKAGALQKARSTIASMPSYFEVNRGQTDPSVRYLSRTGRYSTYLTDDATVISMVGGSIHKGPQLYTVAGSKAPEDKLVESNLWVKFVGANRHPRMEGLEPLPGRINYLIGDQSRWHTNVPTFGRVKIAEVYPGVDVLHYGRGGSLEYDIVAAPGADISKIKLAIEGAARTTLDPSGNVQLRTDAGLVVLSKPNVYQLRADGSREPIAGSYIYDGREKKIAGIASREIGFRVAAYDHSRTIVIDPVIGQIVYSTYLGGGAQSTGPVQLEQFSNLSGGTALTIADLGTDVALDSSNKAYVTGIAYSNNFPTKGTALQTTENGAHSPPQQNPNSFVSKFDYTQSGASSLVWSTYFGDRGDEGHAGAGNGDLAWGIKVDAGGEPFVVGQTYSKRFPKAATTCGSWGQAFDGKASNVNNGFVLKMKSDGSDLLYSCYVDGKDNATERAVDLYPAGCGATLLGTQCKAYVAGTSQSDDGTNTDGGFPGLNGNSFQTVNHATSGKSQGTFIVVHQDGQSLDYSTLDGGVGDGTNADAFFDIFIDVTDGTAWLAGASFSPPGGPPNLTLVNAAQTSFLGTAHGVGGKNNSNALVAHFDPNSSGNASLLYQSYVGGQGGLGTITCTIGGNTSLAIGDGATSVFFDGTNVWIAGFTASAAGAVNSNFPVPGGTETPVFQSSNLARTDAGQPATAGFVTELNPANAGSAQFIYSSFFSGTGVMITGPAGSPFFCTGSVGLGDAITDAQINGGKAYFVGAATSGTIASSFPLSAGACGTLNNTSGFSFSNGLVQIPVTAFAGELDPTVISSAGAQLKFSTLLGGHGAFDIAAGLALDSNSPAQMVIAGLTESTDFPVTQSAFQISNNASENSSSNAFLTVLNPASTACQTPFPTPTSTPTATPATPTATPTKSPTATATATPATPTATLTRTPTPTASATRTATATATASRTATATATASATATAATATATPTKTATPTATATATPATPTATLTRTPTPTASATATKTATPTATATASRTATATATPATPTATPTATATATTTTTPTSTPTPGGGRISVTPKHLTLSTTGDAAVQGAIIVGNHGTGPLNVTISGPNHNPPFTIESNGFEVDPSATVTVTITYSPTSKGNNKDQLSVRSDDPTHKKAIKVKLKGDSD